MNRHDFLSGLFWLGVSIFVVTKALELEVGAFVDPKPGFLLFWSSLIFGILSIVLVVKSITGKSGRTTLADSWKGLAWWNPAITILLLCLYASFLKSIGFLLAMSVLMALLYALGRVKPYVSIAGAIVTVFLAYVIFYFGLQVRFPRGMLGW
jgi:Ca2+/Na+ antiporter